MSESHASPEATASCVLVVGADAELLEQLRHYLTRAGIRARGTRCLDEAWRTARGQALVLFPDDFDAGAVADGLGRVCSGSPYPKVIIITAGPRLFDPLLESLGRPDSVVVMPKPVWGWTILELLRGAPACTL
jgi:hypothetical protein